MVRLFALAIFGWFLTTVVSSADEITDELPSPPEGKTWKLVWNDEFDGDKLDASKWDVPDSRRRDGWWSPKAVSVENGHLVISTLKDGDKYLDACVRTRGKFEHAHGYYVARIKLQEQPGHWSAFWLYNSCVGKVGNEGRDGTEIDIMEKPWLDDRVQHALHWDGYGSAHRSKGQVSTVPDVMEGFHTFSLWWKPDGYIFYVDGKETWKTDDGGVCQVPLYIKLSDEIGKWGGDITKAKLPDRFLVDYVRVYDLVNAKQSPRRVRGANHAGQQAILLTSNRCRFGGLHCGPRSLGCRKPPSLRLILQTCQY
jgi:beta-glucanase (GH16 family)